MFQVEKIARLFIEVLLDYQEQKKFLLHEFVVMPDHFHLILTQETHPSLQLRKGGIELPTLKNYQGDAGAPSFPSPPLRKGGIEYRVA